MCRLRGGSAGAARGAKSLLTETVSRVRNAGSTGQLTVRADSAFYSKAVLHTALELDVHFSITARQDKKIRAAIEAVAEQAWQRPYWLSTPEVSGADVAEISYTAFTGSHALPVRLIVRRTRPTPGSQLPAPSSQLPAPSSQLALFTTWSYHAFVVTDREGPTLELEADHRRHAIVEQRLAELKSAGLAHLPSGNLMANAAWLALAVMAHNRGRAVGALAGPDLNTASAATLRRKVFTVPGRLVRTGDDDDTFDSPSPGPGPTRSPPRSQRSPRSRSAADSHPPTPRPGPGEAGRPAEQAHPGRRSHQQPDDHGLQETARIDGGSGLSQPRVGPGLRQVASGCDRRWGRRAHRADRRGRCAGRTPGLACGSPRTLPGVSARALLIVDMQQALVPHLWEAEALVERLAELVGRARALGVAVVFLQQSGPAGGSLAPGGDGWQLVPGLRPSAEDLVVSKTATDSFYGTGLADLLREREVVTVMLGGLASDYCIDATARSAISHRFNVELLSDGHSTVSSSETELTARQIVAHHNRVLAGAIHPGGELRLVTCADALLATRDHHPGDQHRTGCPGRTWRAWTRSSGLSPPGSSVACRGPGTSLARLRSWTAQSSLLARRSP